MNKACLILLISASLFAIPLVQRVSPPQLRKGAIEIGGTTLHLGMTKAAIAEKLPGTSITKDGEDFWQIGTTAALQSLQFTDGRLTYASRNWTTYDNDIAEAFHNAVSYINREGYFACNVNADSKFGPDDSLQRVFIRCGEKTILVARHSFGGKSYNTVDEMVGAIR